METLFADAILFYEKIHQSAAPDFSQTMQETQKNPPNIKLIVTTFLKVDGNEKWGGSGRSP